jgi:hypothetical protein
MALQRRRARRRTTVQSPLSFKARNGRTTSMTWRPSPPAALTVRRSGRVRATYRTESGFEFRGETTIANIVRWLTS